LNKSVLIITPYFAPQSHAAVFRAYKLAKYLPHFGWKPYVLTVDTNYLYNEDLSLLAALPQVVEIIRARYIEPTLRGLRMALSGDNRTFINLKKQSVFDENEILETIVSDQTPLHRLYNYLLDAWVQIPDAHWTWYRPAVRAAKKLIRQYNIPIVFTSANPFTCHKIGSALQKEGCRWVADLRDPHTYCHYMCSRHSRVFTLQRKAEHNAVTKADAVTVASPAIGMILTDTYGLDSSFQPHFIPTGLDEELLLSKNDQQSKPYPYILFSGEFLPEYGIEFLSIFSSAVKISGVQGKNHKLIFVGRKEINMARVTPILKKLGIEKNVEFFDHMPQQQLYGLLKAAKAAVLISSRYFRWWCLYAKLVDYIALQKPVLALVPDPSVARTELNRTRLGIFLDGDKNNCVKIMANFLQDNINLPPPNKDECNRYLAIYQVQAFVKLFESLNLKSSLKDIK